MTSSADWYIEDRKDFQYPAVKEMIIFCPLYMSRILIRIIYFSHVEYTEINKMKQKTDKKNKQ